MTPHERAEKLVAAGGFWEHDDQVNFGILENEIAAAIRAAENDALERAAVRLDQMAISSAAAAAVRALKHKIT
jgi:hypothetical protein